MFFSGSLDKSIKKEADDNLRNRRGEYEVAEKVMYWISLHLRRFTAQSLAVLTLEQRPGSAPLLYLITQTEAQDPEFLW